jgi:hypothetical protein
LQDISDIHGYFSLRREGLGEEESSEVGRLFMAGTVSVFPDVKTARGGTGDYCVVIHRELFLLAPRLHNQFYFFHRIFLVLILF